MRIVRDDLWLCVDCTLYACNGDLTGIDASYDSTQTAARDARIAAVEAGAEKLGPNLVSDFDSESEEGIRDFSACGCDACGSHLVGTMHRFAILGE